MADGYTLEVEATLEQEQYRNRLAQLVNYTKTAGGKMEEALNITANVVDEASKTIKKIEAEKIKPKDFDVIAETARARAEIEELVGTVDALHPDINVGVDLGKAEAEVAGFESVTEKTEIDIPIQVHGAKAAAEIAAVSSASSQLGNNMVIASRGAEQVTSRLGTMALVAGGVGGAFAGIGLAIGGIGVAVAAQLDGVIFGFKRLVGDAKLADSTLADLKKTATETPFDVKDVITLGFRMKAAGREVNQLSGDVRTLADALAVTGGGSQELERLLLQIQQAGGQTKLIVQDVRAINNAVPGFANVWQDAFGKTTFKSGKETVAAILSTLQKLPGAAGAAAAATKETFIGQFSNFKDKIQLQFLDAFTPNKDKIFKALNVVGEALGPALAQLAPVAVDALAALGPIIAKLLTGLAPIIVLFTQVFVILANKILPYIDKFSEKIRSGSIDVENFAKIFGGIVVGGALLKVTAGLFALLTPLFNLLKAAGPLIVGLFSGIGAAVTGIGDAFAFVSLAAEVTGGSVLSVLAGMAAPFAAIVAPILALGIAIASSKKLATDFFNSLKFLGSSFVYLFSSFGDIIKGTVSLLKPIGEALAPIFDGIIIAVGVVITIIGGIARAFGAVLTVLGPIIGFIVKLAIVFSPIGLLIKAIQLAWSKWGDDIKSVGRIMAIIFGGIVNGLEKIGKFIGKLIDGVSGFLSHIPGIGDVFGSATDKVKKTGDEIDKTKSKTSVWADLSKKEISTIKSQVDGLTNGIEGLFRFSDKGLIDAKSVEEVNAQIQKNLAAMQQRIADVQLIVKSGFPTLVTYAGQIGGDLGNSMITGWAQAIRDGNDQPLKETVAALAKQDAIQQLAHDQAAKIKKQLEKQLADDQRKTDAINRKKKNDKEMADTIAHNTALQKKAAEHAAALAKIGPTTSKPVPAVQPSIAGAPSVPPTGTTTTTTTVPTTTVPQTLPAPTVDTKPAEQKVVALKASIQAIMDGAKVVVASAGAQTPKDFIDSFTASWGTNAKPKILARVVEVAQLLGGAGATGGTNAGNAFGDNIDKALRKKIRAIKSKYGENSIIGQALPDLPGGATGIENWKGGPVWVGEKGKELLNLPRGSQIINHNESMKMTTPTVAKTPLSPARMGSQDNVTYHTEVYGVSFDQAAAEWEAKIRAQRRKVMA